jgi:hypothetical protein
MMIGIIKKQEHRTMLIGGFCFCPVDHQTPFP